MVGALLFAGIAGWFLAARAEDEVKPRTYVLLNAVSMIGLAILDLWVAVTEPRPEDDERGAPGS